MEAELRDNLLTLAKLYGAANKMEIVTVAQKALGDWRFFDRLDQSATASFTIRKYDAAVRWFAAQWPDSVAWPEGIVRPPQAEEAA